MNPVRRWLLCGGTAFLAAPQILRAQGAISLAPASAEASDPLSVLRNSWTAWKAAFLTPEGRVVDALQKGASHSESQGYGLYLSARFGDRQTFSLIRSWTEANLAIRPDGLLAWRWLPDATPNVPDMNNASDGDLFYAAGLLAGAEAFGDPAARGKAEAMARALEAACRTPEGGNAADCYLLPGLQGFVHPEGMTLDPSYWMPALMQDLSDAFELERLAMARATALRWLAATAETQLAPDWILAHGASWGAPPAGFSTNTGYEAVRVPLYLCMSGLGDHPMVQRFRRAYAAAGMTDAGVPIVMDPHSGAAIQRDQSPGYAAVAALAGCTLPQSGGISGIPVFTADQPYYPATLHLFALIAQIEGFPKCLPI